MNIPAIIRAKYEVVKQLKESNTINLYLVRNKEKQTTLFLKLFSTIPLDTENQQKIFKKVKTLSSLKHPNLVQKVNLIFEEENNKMGLVEEFVEGFSLEEKLLEYQKETVFFPEEDI